jgi:hypothetical protein
MPVELGTNDPALREQLAQMTKPADAGELKAQIQQIANLALAIPHSVSLLEENTPGSPRFNCYQRSLGLADVRFHSGILEIFPGRDFAKFIVEHHLEEVEPENAQDGDHVIYFGSEIQHAGTVQSGMVESKWGTGHTWRHGVYEVPAYYGDAVRFFRAISRENVVRAAIDFYPNVRIEE